MANNFLQFSFDVGMTDEELVWCVERLALLDTDPQEWAEDPEDPKHTALVREMGEWALVTQLKENQMPFSVSTEQYKAGIVFYSEECGSPDEASMFLQEFLKRWRPRGSIGFDWAYSCSKPRVGEFGGGACFVPATDTKFYSTSEWVNMMDLRHAEVRHG